MREALDNPFVREIDMIRPVPHPEDPEMKLLGNPLRFDGERLSQRACRPLETGRDAAGSQPRTADAP